MLQCELSECVPSDAGDFLTECGDDDDDEQPLLAEFLESKSRVAVEEVPECKPDWLDCASSDVGAVLTGTNCRCVIGLVG